MAVAALAAVPSGLSLAIGAASAAAGAAVAKVWCDSSDSAFARRLAEVQRTAPLTAAPGVDLSLAIRQLLASFDWSLAVEERKLAVLGLGAFLLGAASSERQELPGFQGYSDSASSARRTLDKERRRQLRRIWQICAQPPPSQRPIRSSASSQSSASLPRPRRLIKLIGSTQKHGIVSQSKQQEVYEKLFDPQRGGVRGPHDACAALCYLVSSFFELRREPPGSLRDAERQSLRLAVAALARHRVFDEDRVKDCCETESIFSQSQDDMVKEEMAQFRRGAIALLCFLDAALSWRPIDPWGLAGIAEDSCIELVAPEAGGVSTFPQLASTVRAAMKKAAEGCRVTWRRIGVHLDAIRCRDLPEPWPWVWVQSEDASMLVRNHTKVRLKVELHRPSARPASPWADWPLVRTFAPVPKPVLVAEIGPGIEWALRPRAREGRSFQMRLVTESGVVVCTRRLQRGQTFDFEVPVPPQPRPASATAPRKGAGSEGRRSDREGSVCSTMEPSDGLRSERGSLASSAFPPLVERAQGASHFPSAAAAEAVRCPREQMQAKLLARRRLIEGEAEMAAVPPRQEEEFEEMDEELDSEGAEDDEEDVDSLRPPQQLRLAGHRGRRSKGRRSLTAAEVPSGLAGVSDPLASVPVELDAAICSRCLRQMTVRSTRPANSVYANGVQCDRCATELLIPGTLLMEDDKHFFHCGKCWYDLCPSCALKEMREVWWSEQQ